MIDIKYLSVANCVGVPIPSTPKSSAWFEFLYKMEVVFKLNPGHITFHHTFFLSSTPKTIKCSGFKESHDDLGSGTLKGEPSRHETNEASLQCL